MVQLASFSVQVVDNQFSLLRTSALPFGRHKSWHHFPVQDASHKHTVSLGGVEADVIVAINSAKPRMDRIALAAQSRVGCDELKTVNKSLYI